MHDREHKRAPLSSSAIVGRAAQLADSDGLNAVTLAAIARSFGVQTPSLYEHVRDLAALHDGVRAVAMDELAQSISDAIAGRAQRDALFAFCAAQREYARSHPGRWEFLQRAAGAQAVQSPAAEKLVHVTGATLRGYRIPEDDQTHVIRILGSALNGFVNLERIHSFDHRLPAVEDSWQELLLSLHFLFSHWQNRASTSNEESS